jgi:hypothetical protein
VWGLYPNDPNEPHTRTQLGDTSMFVTTPHSSYVRDKFNGITEYMFNEAGKDNQTADFKATSSNLDKMLNKPSSAQIAADAKKARLEAQAAAKEKR